MKLEDLQVYQLVTDMSEDTWDMVQTKNHFAKDVMCSFCLETKRTKKFKTKK